MAAELHILLWAAALGLAHILLAAMVWTREVGLKYNAGPRDEPREVKSVLAGRLSRARRNFFETFPLFAAAILVAAIAGNTGGHAGWGALLYLIARIVYLPLYALGIPYLRSLVWLASMIGLVIVWLAAAGMLA